MNARFAIALAAGLVVATAGCTSMGNMFSGNGGDGGERSYMSGAAPVAVDPAGTATFGTGSVSTTTQDQRMNAAAGIGMDSD
jgi:hypothetical protein